MISLKIGGIIVAAFIAGAFIASPELRAYAANTVYSTDIVDGEVKNPDIGAGAVTSSKIAGNSISNTKIQDNAVTLSKMAANSINSTKIVDGSVTSADIANGAVGTSKIANGAVTAAKISGAVASEKVISYALAAGAVSAPISIPVADRPVSVMGVQTDPGFRGVGQVTLLRITGAGGFLEWVGLDSTAGAAITEGYNGTAGAKIVYIDFTHCVAIEVHDADNIQVHNSCGYAAAGKVTLMW